MTALCQQLMDFGLKSKETEETKETKEIRKTEDSSSIPVRVLNRHHKHIQQKSCGRYEWGKLHPPGCPRKGLPKKRKFGTDITSATLNGVSEAILGGSRGYYKCSKCQVWLCIEGTCWQRYHHSIGVNC
jgi:hypothetical protein